MYLNLVNEESIFQMFLNGIKTQFGISIRAFRSDSAREYLSNQFHKFMTFNGILHQTSYPHTSQQNGVPKRKHKHLIETTRTLLQSHLPHPFQEILSL